MTTAIGLKDSKTGQMVRVTRFGQLVVSPLDYSDPIARELLVIDTAVNFLTPLAGHSIVITDIIVNTDKDVSPTTPADIEIYEADAVDSLIAAPSIIRPQLVRADSMVLTGLNFLVPEGKWINAKTTDAGVLITLAFYRVPVEKV